MGKDLYDNFSEAREVFQKVDDILKQDLSRLIFGGEIEELTLTANVQPSIMAVSIAALRVLLKQCNFDNISEVCSICAGHSLGEYSALHGACAISLSDTAKLLRIRGKTMQEAVPQGQGAMIALLGASVEQAIGLVRKIQEKGEKFFCQIANDNGAGQIVLSGTALGIEQAEMEAKNFEIKRVIRLQVSGPFHSKLMKSASVKVAAVLEEIEIQNPLVPVVQNYTARIAENPEIIKDSLIRQVTDVVRWDETMTLFEQEGVTRIIEIGPGKVLSNLATRKFGEREGDIQVLNFGSVKDEELFKIITTF